MVTGMIRLLTGDEAVALGALHAGIGGVFSYPGTPATEIFEFVERHADECGGVSARWSTNEKVAYEEALGMSFVGRRALVSMKHVGLNVAADPFMSSALTGANGGLVVAVADDPGMHSSQNEQDTRFYASFAQVPLFEPSNQQEAYDMAREAFEVSEELGLPVLLRLVTRLAHSRTDVHVRPATPPPCRTRAKDWRDWTLLPANARRRFARVLSLQPELQALAERSKYNRIELRGPKGVITTGLARNYYQEAMRSAPARSALRSPRREVSAPDSSAAESREGAVGLAPPVEHDAGTAYSVLQLCVYPVPVNLVREFVAHCSEITVLEEGYPFVERQLRGLLGVPGKTIHGKLDGTVPIQGELTTDIVRRALLGEPSIARGMSLDLPDRPPQLCSGCPHCDTFHAVIEAASQGAEPFRFSDIGCYTLAALPPYNAVDTCVEMGASIGMAIGAAKAGAHPVIAIIGDSTFVHSGLSSVVEAAHENVNMTLCILDNALVAMTGGQEVFATGEDLIRILRGLGVDERHLVRLDPVPAAHQKNVERVRRELEHRGLSVIVSHRACIHAKRRAGEATRPPAITLAAGAAQRWDGHHTSDESGDRPCNVI